MTLILNGRKRRSATLRGLALNRRLRIEPLERRTLLTTISGIVVAEAVPQNGILESNEQGIITWLAGPSSPGGPAFVKSGSVIIDNNIIPPSFGPNQYGANQVAMGAIFGPLAAGTHNYTINVLDNQAVITTHDGHFSVAPAPTKLTISNVVVAEAVPKNGVLETGEQAVITFVAGPLSIFARSVTVDGKIPVPLSPPAPSPGGSAFWGLFGPLAAGTHSYTINVEDSSSAMATVSGTFQVVQAPLAGVGSSIFDVVVAEASWQNGVLEADELGVVTFLAGPGTIAALLQVDGLPVSPLFRGSFQGEIAFSGVFGHLGAGNHTYTITVAGPNGTSSVSGGFTVAPAANLAISDIVAAEAVWQNGLLETGEQGVITFLTGSATIAFAALHVDSQLVTPLVPSVFNGQSAFSALIGPYTVPGAHTFVIDVFDDTGASTSANGIFTVAA